MSDAPGPPTPSSPILRQALAYWQSKLRGREMPALRDIDPVEVPRLLPHLMLIDVLRDPLDFRYRQIGAAVREVTREDYTGMRYSELPGKGKGSVVWGNCERVVVTRRPFARVPPYVGPKKDVQPHENLLLPLSDDGAAVDTILYVVHCVRLDQLSRPFA